jgi:hypothetical protein
MESLMALVDGCHLLAPTWESGALDYVRGSLVARDEMRPLPMDLPGEYNDLNEKICARAGDPRQLLRRGLDHTLPDPRHRRPEARERRLRRVTSIEISRRDAETQKAAVALCVSRRVDTSRSPSPTSASGRCRPRSTQWCSGRTPDAHAVRMAIHNRSYPGTIFCRIMSFANRVASSTISLFMAVHRDGQESKLELL